MADNSHAERKIRKRGSVKIPPVNGQVARMRLRPARSFYSLSDALNAAEIDREFDREHSVLTLEDGDYPRVKLADTSQGEREPE